MNSKSPYPRVGVGVFVWHQGKFLVQKRLGSHGAQSWSLPGGHLEFKETIAAAAKREVLEELGVRIKNIEIVAATNDIFKKEAKHYITIWVKSELASGTPTIMEPHRIAEIRWADFANLPRPLFLPWRNLKKAKPELFS